MIKKSLCCSVMVASLYFLMGCSESQNTEALGAETAQAAAEEAVASAEDIADILDDASVKADEGAAFEGGDANVASDEGYTDEGSVNPIKQLLEGEPVEVSYSPNQFMTELYERPAYDIVIQAKTDQVTVYDITINRGNNCHITKYDRDKKLPTSLSFGRMIKLSIGCDPNYII